MKGLSQFPLTLSLLRLPLQAFTDRTPVSRTPNVTSQSSTTSFHQSKTGLLCMLISQEQDCYYYKNNIWTRDT